jgi:1,4-alpha-glucan branching enzyme
MKGSTMSIDEPNKNAGAPREAGVSCGEPRYDITLLTEEDLYLFNEGNHSHLFEKLGNHLIHEKGKEGVYFAVWAPNAKQVFVQGDFNNWQKETHPLMSRGASGIWEGFIPGIMKGTTYKYHIVSRYNDYRVDKADPFAPMHETPPNTASKVWDLDYSWRDETWVGERRSLRNALDAPQSVYEVHLGSWMRVPGEGGRSMTYRELAPRLAEYVSRMNFTHVEFLPIMEHPFYGSWGYMTTGYFAPTSRYGNPQDFMALIDELHAHGIGVILDWVPSHFPGDEHGLVYFDGTHLFEHADPRQGIQPEWNSYLFNYGRNEVRSFLLSSAVFWLKKYHVDGLRVDAVASMLYLDYSRKEGEWIPNQYGGNENLDAIEFLRRFNEEIYRQCPDVQTIAEESTAWPMVSRPNYVGGLGFGMKWDMGWMHDTLSYISKDPIHRKHHHHQTTFRMVYAFNENFVLPLSHDEIVYGKGSLLSKMPGDEWQKAANLRMLFGYMYAQPGKKLLFMGGEFGQVKEWYHETGLDWELSEQPVHKGIHRWVEDLNRFYRERPALYELDFDTEGFQWIDCNDAQHSILSFLRKGKDQEDRMVVVCNFTPVVQRNYKVGVPVKGVWKEILNSDAELYGGSGQGNLGGVEASPIGTHGHPFSLTLSLPPLAVLFLEPLKDEQA